MKRLIDGFTFIELLVVISIILLLFGFSMGMYNNFNEQKKLDTETTKFIEILDLTKNKILAGDKSGLDIGLDLYSKCDLVKFKITTSSNEYSLKAIVSQNNNGNCPTDFVDYKDIDLSIYKTKPEIIISSSEIIFYPFGLGIDTCKCISLQNTITNKHKYVKIDKSGTINIMNTPCFCS
jgi:prepilin-type N-terminal cleavage/methylation domain-containing protein